MGDQGLGALRGERQPMAGDQERLRGAAALALDPEAQRSAAVGEGSLFCFWMLVLDGFVSLHTTVPLQLLQCTRQETGLDYCTMPKALAQKLTVLTNRQNECPCESCLLREFT